MRGGPFYTAALIAALAGTAATACPIEQSGLPERLGELSSERGVLTPEAAAALREMRSTAGELDRLGFGGQCEEVLDTALSLIESEAAWQAPVTGDTIAVTVGSLNLAALSSSETRATTLIGRPVLTVGGSTFGVVEDVVFDPAGSATHALVRRGGWSDETARMAVPAGRLLTEPAGRLYVEVPAAAVDDAPEWSEDADLASNDRWYAEQAGLVVDQRATDARKARTAQQARAAIGMQGKPESAVKADAKTDGTPVVGPKETIVTGGPKRIRVERDRPESAQGSSD